MSTFWVNGKGSGPSKFLDHTPSPHTSPVKRATPLAPMKDVQSSPMLCRPLSPKPNEWPQAEQQLRKFSADMFDHSVPPGRRNTMAAPLFQLPGVTGSGERRNTVVPTLPSEEGAEEDATPTTTPPNHRNIFTTNQLKTMPTFLCHKSTPSCGLSISLCLSKSWALSRLEGCWILQGHSVMSQRRWWNRWGVHSPSKGQSSAPHWMQAACHSHQQACPSHHQTCPSHQARLL